MRRLTASDRAAIQRGISGSRVVGRSAAPVDKRRNRRERDALPVRLDELPPVRIYRGGNPWSGRDVPAPAAGPSPQAAVAVGGATGVGQSQRGLPDTPNVST